VDQTAGLLPARTHVRGRISLVRRALFLVTGGAVLWLALTALGLFLTRTAAGRTVTRWDTVISRWAAAHRTATLNGWTHLGSSISNTSTVVAVTVVALLVLGPMLRRWHDAVIVLVAVLGELVVFVLVTATVERARPPVPHLDPAPPTSSFPSGHTAAAMALHVGLAVICMHSPVPRRAAWPLATLLCLIPVIVAVSRIYRGMHYFTDVVAGAILGGTWLVLTLRLAAPLDGPARSRGAPADDGTDY